MHVAQLSWSETAGWTSTCGSQHHSDLGFFFGMRQALSCGGRCDVAAVAPGPQIPQLGFYSHGEISPHCVSGVCELHNQTMTVTAIAETTDLAGA